MSYENYINLAIDEMNLRGYSIRTIGSYSANLRKFLLFINKPVDDLTTEDVRFFLLDLKSRHLSTSYINGSYSVCQLFFKSVLKKHFLWTIFLVLKIPRNFWLFFLDLKSVPSLMSLLI